MTIQREFPVTDIALARALAERAGAHLLALRATCTALDAQALGAAGDAEANALLLSALRQARPHDAVLSEESADDGSRLGAARVWIIDPLDGTREFRDGGDDWAVHIALVSAGCVRVAAVAQAARGVCVAVDTSAAPSEPEAISWRRVVVSRTRAPAFAARVAHALGATLHPLGSAGVKALAVVRGEALAYVHAGGMNEWDAAAPVGVALAHGLHVSDLRGEPITFNRPDVVLHEGLIICRSELAATVLDAL